MVTAIRPAARGGAVASAGSGTGGAGTAVEALRCARARSGARSAGSSAAAAASPAEGFPPAAIACQMGAPRERNAAMTAIRAFTFKGLPSRVVFGDGTLGEVGPEIERLGRSRALVLSTAGHAAAAERLAADLGARAAGVFAGAVMHTPVDVTEAALAAYAAAGADCVVALGGGSTIGLGKAIAVRTGADQVAVPTTYAGSEMTDILGETAGGRKTTRRDPAIQPETVIYDVGLTIGLPPALTATSGMNALAHAVEALYAPRPQPDPEPDGARGDRGAGRVAAGAGRGAGRPRPPGAGRSTAPGSAARRSAARRWRCTTSSAMCSAARSACRMPRPTRWCCRMPRPTTRPPPGTCWRRSARRWAAAGRARRSPASPRGSARRGRFRELGLAEADLDRAADLAVEAPYCEPAAGRAGRGPPLLAAAWAGEPPAG